MYICETQMYVCILEEFPVAVKQNIRGGYVNIPFLRIEAASGITRFSGPLHARGWALS